EEEETGEGGKSDLIEGGPEKLRAREREREYSQAAMMTDGGGEERRRIERTASVRRRWNPEGDEDEDEVDVEEKTGEVKKKLKVEKSKSRKVEKLTSKAKNSKKRE
ncbi:hypothetical protein TRV_04829, partial [Trichophyton verrucosum HKI 0517]